MLTRFLWRDRHKVIGFVDAATHVQIQLAADSNRHKVIGFVDAATWPMTAPRRNCSATRSLASWMPRLIVKPSITDVLHRHKVIGFVDAATVRRAGVTTEHVRHKVIGFVDAATVIYRQTFISIVTATRSLASWMPRRSHVVPASS